MSIEYNPLDSWCLLHLEDSPLDHALVMRSLRKSGRHFSIARVETLHDFEQAITGAHFDAIVADYRLSGFTALDAWMLIQRKQIRVPFILLSGAIGESAAVAAIKTGISDYLPKDDISKLHHVIERAIELHHIRLAKEASDLELARSEQRMASFAEHLQSTIEQERAAISREIHDDIGGALAAIRFDLFWLKRHNAELDAQEHVQAATDMLQQAIEASQRIMMNLRPAILDQGLAAAIQWLTNNFSKRTGIVTVIALTHELGQLSKTVQLVAYRTAQEALTNISKHANCTQVRIDMSDAEDVLTLEINDNGQGMTAQDMEKQKSFGLRGMKERAKAVGGWLDISSQLGQGTSITLSIPLQQDLNMDGTET
jgi:two-component system, NarL family, sensor histidine kinase UhpB